MLFEAIRKLFGGSKKCAGDSKMERGSSCACKGKEKNNASAGTVKLSDLEDFVSYVVKNLVDAPEEVKVETIVENNAKTIRISCRKDDTGKIIGKKGKTIIALRALVAGAAGRMQDRVSVEVAD
jgi:predicted RNA-binding protein YlqC (UPF0109 family)